MLSLQTSQAWGSASATITIGAGVDTWACTPTSNSAVDALEDLCTWANDAGRPWFGAALFQWGWARHGATGGAVLKVKNSGGAFAWAPNGTAAALLGIAAGGAAVEHVGTAAAAGTWAPWPDGLLPLRLGSSYWDKAPGQGSGVGAVRPVVAGVAPWAGVCRAVVGPTEAQRWPELLAAASHPRRCWLRQSNVQLGSAYVVPPIGAGWLLLALGQTQRAKAGVRLWSFDLSLGSAV